MKRLLYILITIIMLVTFNQASTAQGCVAIRSTGAVCTRQSAEGDTKGWQLNLSYRYFKSFRHFKGEEEQKERLEDHTEVINWQHALDVSVLRRINDRWSILLGVPILANSRSSLYEHGRTERHRSESFGIGDMRAVAYRWMLDPAKYSKGNFQIGLGLKLPTGDYNAQDYFYNVGPGGTKEARPVDQSIQLGDGGTGIIAEVNGYYNFAKNFGLYGNVYYLSNPKEINGTRTFRETLSPVLANEAIMSVADQYMARVGFNVGFGAWSASAGGRIEGIPVEDLVGGSLGFRRPGYVISAEPGLNYIHKKTVVFLTVPIALDRNRTRSVTDKEASETSGTYRHGDAAFADYSINVGVSIKL